MRSTRLRSSRAALIPIFLLVAAVITWPVVDSLQRQSTSAQNVGWLGPNSSSYLTSAGIPVMVPSWLPGPVAGVSPEIYAGGGSYSIYFYAGGSFLYITGVAGATFPGGSEANLNVELSVNTSVHGYPAIRDIGIPEGSSTPIYDKIMWIAGGVLYTVSGNGLDTDSQTLANSSVTLQAPAPAPAPTNPPAVSQPPADSGGSSSSSGQDTSTGSTTNSSTSPSESSTAPESAPASTGVVNESDGSVLPAAAPNDGTGGPWYTGHGVSDLPSDGTAGPTPPRMFPDDGTGGAS